MIRFIVPILLVFVALLFLVTSNVDLEGITGLATQINVGVKSVELGRVTMLSHPLTITQYSTMNITTEFTNIGSANIIGRIEIHVLNSDMTETLASFYDGYTELVPGARRTMRTRYIVRNSSFHWIHVIVPYENYQAESWGLFYAFPYYPETTPSFTDRTDTGTGVGGGSSELAESGERELKITYPETVEAVQGGSTLFHIMAENTGGLSLRDLTMEFGSSDINLEASPTVIARLYPGSTNVFLVSVDIPINTSTGKHNVSFTLSSGDFTRTGELAIIVGGLDQDDDIAMMISNYIYMLGLLGNQMEELSIQGKNVSLVREHMANAIRSLEYAKTYHENGNKALALEELKEVRFSAMAAAEEISRLFSIRVFPIIIAPAYISLSLLVLVTSVMFMIFLILYKRRKHQDKEELEE